MKIKFYLLILGIASLYIIGGSCSPVKNQTEKTPTSSFASLLAKKIVLEIHRSLYGSYGGLNLKGNYTNSYAHGFSLKDGKLVEDLDSLGNEEWSLKIDTLIQFKSPSMGNEKQILQSMIHYSLNFTTETLNNSRSIGKNMAMVSGYKLIQASSAMKEISNHLVINGGLDIQSKFQETPILLNFHFNSVSINDKTGNVEGGNTRFQAFEPGKEKFSIQNGTIDYFPGHLAKIQIGDQLFKADLRTGKIFSI